MHCVNCLVKQTLMYLYCIMFHFVNSVVSLVVIGTFLHKMGVGV